MTKLELREMICDTLGIEETTPIIEKQIHKYVSELGLSYKEIAQALVFYIEIDKGDYDPKYGIGIVPMVVDRARIFFKRKREEQKRQIESVKEANKEPDIILNVTKIRKRKKLPKIDLNEIEVD